MQVIACEPTNSCALHLQQVLLGGVDVYGEDFTWVVQQRRKGITASEGHGHDRLARSYGQRPAIRCGILPVHGKQQLIKGALVLVVRWCGTHLIFIFTQNRGDEMRADCAASGRGGSYTLLSSSFEDVQSKSRIEACS